MLRASITIPWVRYRGLVVCIDAIGKNAGLDASEYEMIDECDAAMIGVPGMMKKLVGISRADTVMFIADDCIPQPDFLKNALEAMKKLPGGWGLVGLNDGYRDGNKIATHFLADKRLLPQLGGEFYHSGYRHCCVGWELTRRCKDLGRYIGAEDARVIHNHPGIHSTLALRIDADYRRVYWSGQFAMGHLTYLKRRLTGWR